MSLVVYSWNVNGIRSVAKKGFNNFLEQYSPDILCIQETRANSEDFPAGLEKPEGYESFHETALKKGYSGVSLYTKIKPLEIKNQFQNTRFDGEGRIQIADYGFFVLFLDVLTNNEVNHQAVYFLKLIHAVFLLS